VDGFTAARWRLVRDQDRGTLRVEPFRRFPRPERGQVEEEGGRLAAFLTDADARVQIEPYA
jgi:hypothetical protein